MSVEDHKILARRAIELFGSENSDRPGDIFAEGCRVHQQPDPLESVNPSHPIGWKAILETYHERVVASHEREHQSADTGSKGYFDLAAWEGQLQKFHTGFSNVQVDVLGQVAEADTVCTRWQIEADHTGEFAGIAPTLKRIIWTGVTTDRIEAGRIAETWFNWDKYGFAKGLGLVR
ncbi:MAG: ester cyclase [Pseudomonadota bacterium]